MSFKDHFSAKASDYAKARPTYPPALFAALADLAPGRALAWDVGTGNGQAAVKLAEYFERVVATEPSAEQLAQATAHPKVTYHQAAELARMVADASVDLVTVAQAVHWFDRPKFYTEVQRVLRPGGVVALWAYEFAQVSPEVDAVILRFYQGEIGPYWPPERAHVETGYRGLEFPFAEFAFPRFAMTHHWRLAELMAYIRTWSAVQRFTKDKGHDPVLGLERELAPLWGCGARAISWPLAGRIGRRG